MRNLITLTCGIAFLLSLFTGCNAYPSKPNTNGHFCTQQDSDFREFRYAEYVPICYRNVSYNERTQIYKNYGIDLSTRSEYIIDHIIPLSMGGSNHFDNLWPQNKEISTTNIEGVLFRKLDKGTITHQEAICEIVKAKKLKKRFFDCY